MPNQAAKKWLSIYCRMIPGARCAILLQKQPNNGIEEPLACWPVDIGNIDFLMQVGQMCQQRQKTVLQNSSTGHQIDKPQQFTCAFPISQNNSVTGTLVIQIENLNRQKLLTAQEILHWGSAGLEFPSHQTQAVVVAARLAAVLEISAKSLESKSLQESTTSVITNLAQAFKCTQVSFGQLTEDRDIQITALSHSAQIDRRSEIIQSIEAAMLEALEESRSLVFPILQTQGLTGHLPQHQRLCDLDEKRTVCTIILNNNGAATGAITLERNNGQAFDNSSVEVLEAIAAMIGPVFELKRIQERPILSKAKQAIVDTLKSLIGKKRLRTKVTLALLLAGTLLSSLMTDDYRVSARATLEGTEHRALVAAMDGFVDQSYSRSGDKVSKGDVIATLDTSNLTLKHRQLISERDNLLKKHDRALGSFDRAEAAIIQAQIGKADAELNLIEDQIKRTQIIAPIDGIIVSGDLSQTLGAPIERGQVLFEVAPLNSYRMALHVDETEIRHVKPGQKGVLALSASPNERLNFTIENIIGIASNENNNNGFRVEAKLDENFQEPHTGEQLRPGMQGVGKISTSERSLLWIWGHTLFDKLSIWIWSYLP